MLKLGPHYLPGGEDATIAWLRLKPAVVKFCYGGYEMSTLADPFTLTLGRPDERFLGSPGVPFGEGFPDVLARQFVREVYAPLAAAFPAIQVWEGPNEINPDTPRQMQWYGEFLYEFARQIHMLNRRAGIGAWAPGTPELEMWQGYTAALQACREFGAVLTRHSYGALDEWLGYRHRKDNEVFTKLGYPDLPVIISECGADRLGSCPGRWRQIYTSEAEYWERYLKPFTAELDRDDYVLGATVFTVGTGFSQAWRDFDVGMELVACLPTVQEEQVSETVVTNPEPNVTIVTTAVAPESQIAAVQAKIRDMHRALARDLAGYPEARVVLSRPESAHWMMIFTSPEDAAPARRHVDYDMTVLDTQTDAEGVVWLKVYNQPAMWVLKDQTAPKPQPI